MDMPHKGNLESPPSPSTLETDTREPLTSLLSSAREILRGTNLSKTLKSICEDAPLFLGTDRISIKRFHSKGRLENQVIFSNNVPSKYLEILDRSHVALLTPESFTNESLIAVQDIQEESKLSSKAPQEDGPRTVWIIPIFVEAVLFGTIYLFFDEVRQISPSERHQAEMMRDLVSFAVQNAQFHEESQRSRNFFRSVVEDNADAIIVTDRERKILSWNAGAETLYGYTEAEAVGQSISDLIFPPGLEKEGDPALDARIDQRLIKEGSIKVEVERKRKDDTLVSVDLTLSPVKDDEGDIIAVCSISKNLTLRKNVETALEEAKEAAEAANKAKGEFLSNVSHELRSPLNAVIGFSDLLMMSTKDEETLRLLPKIRSAGKYLSRLIDDLRDVDRIDTGKMQMDFTEVSMNHLIKNLIDSRSGHLPEEFTLEQKLDPGVEPIVCDPTRISQVINNLFDNAIKYSPDGGTICIQSEHRSSEVWISVQDQGMGIGTDNQNVIFERFRQLGDPKRRGTSGLGIGLYLVHHILSLHKGRIWVESEIYKGSTFTFALPYETAELAETTAEDDSSGAPPLPGAEPWTGRKVLLVDDLEIFHEYIRLLMKSASGFISAFNGQEGAEVARLEQPDLILMDLRMPVMDGFDSIKQIKSDPSTKEIPIIAVTAQAMEKDRKHSLNMGANGFVTKPVDLNILRQEIERVLSPQEK